MFSTEVERFDKAEAPGGVFVHDRRTGRTRRISITPGGRPAGLADLPSISANGRFVSFRADGLYVRGPLR